MRNVSSSCVALWLVSVAVAATLAQQAPMRTVWEGVFTTAQADRGDKLFAQRCATCHGADMLGGAGVPGVSGLEFVAAWNNLTVGGVFEVMKGSMPADNPGGLSDQQYVDLLAAMLRGSEFPASMTTELPGDKKLLDLIRITRTKP